MVIQFFAIVVAFWSAHLPCICSLLPHRQVIWRCGGIQECLLSCVFAPSGYWKTRTVKYWKTRSVTECYIIIIVVTVPYKVLERRLHYCFTAFFHPYSLTSVTRCCFTASSSFPSSPYHRELTLPSPTFVDGNSLQWITEAPHGISNLYHQRQVGYFIASSSRKHIQCRLMQ